MSLVEALGLDEEQIPAVVQRCWGRWSERVPALGCVPVPEELGAWRRSAPSDVTDRVLRGLAELAAKDGGDDTEAATVLAWLMVPGVLRYVSAGLAGQRDADVQVAAQLWIEVRSFPWRTTGRVAGNILWRLRKAVLAEFGDRGQLENRDRTLARTYLDLSIDLLRASHNEEDTTAADARDDVLAVLEWGRRQGVISEVDRRLLLDVLTTSEEAPGAVACLPLLGDRVSDQVAARWGVTGRTVRRRAARSIAALAATVGAGGRSATLARIAWAA